MSKPYVVFLNGPPGSGKDFAANILQNHALFSVSKYKFAEPLKTMTCALLEISTQELERSKSQVVEPYGVTIRQLLIDISEKWMKPQYGNDIFGRIAATHLAEEMQLNDHLDGEQPDLFVFSDCGFDKEVEKVVELFGADNCLLIRLHREGCTYEGDSRSYIELSDVHSVDATNCGTSAFGMNLVKTVKQWMESKGTTNE